MFKQPTTSIDCSDVVAGDEAGDSAVVPGDRAGDDAAPAGIVLLALVAVLGAVAAAAVGVKLARRPSPELAAAVVPPPAGSDTATPRTLDVSSEKVFGQARNPALDAYWTNPAYKKWADGRGSACRSSTSTWGRAGRGWDAQRGQVERYRRGATAEAKGTGSVSMEQMISQRAAPDERGFVPYILVLGDREVEGRATAPRPKGGEQQGRRAAGGGEQQGEESSRGRRAAGGGEQPAMGLG